MKRLVGRSWGWYLVLLDRKHFKVKLLRFRPGAAKMMSVQRHICRSELWLFLKGTGWFHNDPISTEFSKDYFIVSAGDYVDVLHGSWHTFFPFCKTLVLEIQYGEACLEEDIVRI